MDEDTLGSRSDTSSTEDSESLDTEAHSRFTLLEEISKDFGGAVGVGVGVIHIVGRM